MVWEGLVGWVLVGELCGEGAVVEDLSCIKLHRHGYPATVVVAVGWEIGHCWVGKKEYSESQG